jgi:hypothetical protein
MSEEARSYNREGILVRPFAKTPKLERLNALCRDIFEGRAKDGYGEVVHYEGTARDVALDHNYDPVLLDILFENDLPRRMKEFVGPNATLYNINAITSIPPGYVTFWHTDDQPRMVHKIFYYPVFGDGPNSHPCLQVMPGNFRSVHFRGRIFRNRFRVWIEDQFFRKQLVTSSDDNFVVLNTTVMHRAVPVTEPQGSFRLMYSFIDWFRDEEERQAVTSLRYSAEIHINNDIVQHYQTRLASSGL